MKKLFLFIAVTCLFSCVERSTVLYSRIDSLMDNCDSLTIRMTDIVQRPWDTMYVLQPMSHYPGLEHYQNYPDYHDIGRRIVFVKDGTVVFRDDEIAVEWPYSVELYSDSLYFTPETAVFLTTKYIRRNEWDRRERTYYVLRPLIGTTTMNETIK